MKSLLIGLILLFLPLMDTHGTSMDIKATLKNLPSEHPRLFLTRAQEAEWKSDITSSPFLQPLASHVVDMADAIIPLPPSERKMTGRRLLTISRLTLKRILYLGTAYRLTNERRYADRAIEEMKAIAVFSDWNPSHFLDVAEMTTALAIGYDWLYHELSQEDRELIKEALIEKGLKPSFPENLSENLWWIDATNNWNQVCHTGMTLGALAVYEDIPDLAERILERAVRKLPLVMDGYGPDGAYPEGATYWSYGTTYNVLFLDAVSNALGTDFGLSKRPGFMESSDYMQHVVGATGTYFNYSDCGLDPAPESALYWMAKKRNDPSLIWKEQDKLDAFYKRDLQPSKDYHRFVPLLLLWATAPLRFDPPTETYWSGKGETPVAFHRSGWEKDATYAAIKGGSPHTSHAHMDSGSFVLEMNGVRWAHDLGMQSYYSLEKIGFQLWDKTQDGQRWDVFRLGTYSHNTLVIDGQQQRVKGKSLIIHSEGSPTHLTVVDLSPAYKGQLASAKRSLHLHEHLKVTILDDIETLDKETTLRWAMVTRAKVEIKDGSHAVLREGDTTLEMTLEGIEPAEWKTWDISEPANEWDQANPGYRMIGFELTLPALTKQSYTVRFTGKP